RKPQRYRDARLATRQGVAGPGTAPLGSGRRECRRPVNESRWNRIEAVYQAVLDRPDSERESFLDTACARDRDLRAEIDELEAHAVARLNHPHICALYDVGSQDDMEFLVMEYLDGETLASRLRRGPILAAEALAHAVALSQAIACAHNAGILHRDLKPSNV